MELLRTMLEEQLAVHTAKLTQLTVYARLPRQSRYDPHVLDTLATATRRRIAETAHALNRMSDGTYGSCEVCRKPLPLGRLRTMPHTTRCTLCERRDPRPGR
jgi:RNA polymerase-binding transcription factor DksA